MQDPRVTAPPAGPDVTERAPAVVAVSALARDGAGRVMCVRRAGEPHRGRWSLPGGRVEVGEDLAAAVVREVAEESGLEVEAGALLGSVRVTAPDGGAAFDVHVFAVTIGGGCLRPGDDADDVAWLTREQLLGVPHTPGLVDLLDDTGAFGRGGTVAEVTGGHLALDRPA